MNRSWFGFALLLLLLALALIASWSMEQIHKENAEWLEQAAVLALADNWSGAVQKISDVRHNWTRWKLLRSALADHTPMEAIEASFSSLELYCARQELLPFAALCRELARQMDAMGDAHRLKAENLL